jgi:hypothetical protein
MTTRLSEQQHEAPLEVLLQIAGDLTAALGARDRYARLLTAVRRAISCDAACLHRLGQRLGLRREPSGRAAAP